MPSTTAVLGGGSWGTALAWLLGGKGRPVRLWCRDPHQAAAIRERRENTRYLPDVRLPEAVRITSDLPEALCDARCCVLAVPTQSVRTLAESIRGALPSGAAVLIAAKGLERGTGLRMTEVVDAATGGGWANRIAILSGPNLSGELVQSLPTSTVIGVQDVELARSLQELFATPFFRVYTNADVTGVELGGALKNPLAITAGISDGMGFGQNTKAALLTRGLAEMTRLGVAAGAQAATFSGLSGLGDLLATAQSPLSRNYQLGHALGRGEALPQALTSLGHVAEGVPTTDAACTLAERFGIELPITSALREFFAGRLPLEKGVARLLTRAYRDEG